MYFQACFEQGRIAEDSFSTIAKSRKWNVIRSSNKEDRYEKWDFLIQKDENCEDFFNEHNDEDCRGLRVDVKSMKKMQRSDNTPQDHWVWIELHGTSKNNGGWLYDSKAHALAFETMKSFVIVDRLKLIDFVKKNVDRTVPTKNPLEAFYREYRRKGFDQITLVEMNKLRKFCLAEWMKPSYMVSSDGICSHIRSSLHDCHKHQMNTILADSKSIRLRTKRLREVTDTIIEYTYCPLCAHKFTNTDPDCVVTKYRKLCTT